MTKPKHIHKLKRHTYSTGTTTFYCTDDECTFKVSTEFSLGKMNICWGCNNPFKMDSYAIRAAKPKCTACRGSLGKKRTLLEKINVKVDEIQPLPAELSDAEERLRQKLLETINPTAKDSEL